MTKYVRDTIDWPPIMIGPIVRRVDANAVSVFVATKEAASVRLDLFAGTSTFGVHTSPAPIASSHATATVPLGRHLHVAVVTADGLSLAPGNIYGYDVAITETNGPETNLAGLGLLSGDVPLGYDADELPAFVLPHDRDKLKFVHGSCRKAHGGGPDMLPTVDALIAADRADPDERLQQLLLTGDQIYADDVAPGLLAALTEAGELMLAWDEPESFPSDTGSWLPVDLEKPGRRSELLDAAGAKPRTHYADNHLLYYGEWCAIYVMAWSDAIWRRGSGGTTYDLPQPTALPWQREHDSSTNEALLYAEKLPHVRRALANVATYMLFDDHEVTDDWNLNKAVSDRLRSNVTGRRLLRNALVSYAVFQDWGNQPADYDPGSNGRTILDAVTAGTGTGNTVTAPTIGGTPSALDDVLDIDETPKTVAERAQRKRWDLETGGPGHQIIFMDTRTWRSFPSGVLAEKYNAGLVSEEAQQFQLSARLADLGDRRPIIVSPAPVIGLWLVEVLQKLKIAADPVHGTEAVDNEPWAGDSATFTALLDGLVPYSPVIFLSGDVHYAFSQVSAYRNPSGDLARFIQLCSSSTKNSDNLTNFLSISELLTGPLKENWWISSVEASEFLSQQGPDLTDRASELLGAWWNDLLHGLPDIPLKLKKSWREFWKLHWVPGLGLTLQLPELIYAGPVAYDQLTQLATLLEVDIDDTTTIKTLMLEDSRETESRDDHSTDLQDELSSDHISAHERLGILNRNRGSVGVSNVGLITFGERNGVEFLRHDLYWRHVREAVDPLDGAMFTRHEAELRNPVDHEDTSP